MNNKRQLRVSGLANIGALIGKAELPKAVAPEKMMRRDTNAIFHRTREKIGSALGLHTSGHYDASEIQRVETYLLAGMREAYNLGHHDALDQNSAVEKLLEQQYDARTKVTMPAVAAGIMEQQGLSSMPLDLALLATVFKRNTIDYSVSDADVIEYHLLPLDVVQA